jgi:3-oxoacyl-[acyl-carrier-protein] synthase II
MEERDVVITGLGLVTPLGRGCEENWEMVNKGKTGICHHPVEGLPSEMQYFAKVKDASLPQDLPPKLTGQIKFLNRGALLGFLASDEAVRKAAFPLEQVPPGRRALFIASGDFTKVGYDYMYPAVKEAVKHGGIDFGRLNTAALDKVNPFFLLESLQNNLFSFLSAYLEFMGPNTSLGSLSPCGSQTIELAYRTIRQDKADIAVAVGYGSWINEIALYELDTLGLLSRCREGERSFRPFDRHRDGFIPGEGGAALFLEAYGPARQRGANILGTIKGVANYNEFVPGKGLSVPEKVSRKGMELALGDAGSTVGELGFITTHGSGTRRGDRSEMASFADIFEAGKADAPICAIKPYTGHLGAASDIGEIIIAMHAAGRGVVPATLNFDEPERGFSSLKISSGQQPCAGNSIMSVSYGMGGQSSIVVIKVEKK